MQSKTEYIQDQYKHLKSLYFNTAYFGPSPKLSQSLMENAVSKELDPSFYPYHDWMSLPGKLRQSFAQFLQVPAHLICHATSVSDLNTLLGHVFVPLTPKKRNLIVSVQDEYPSNVLPWMVVAQNNENIDFQLLKNPKKTVCRHFLERSLPSNTFAFILSHVSFNTGNRIDLLELGQFLKSKNILFIIDTSQSLGSVYISLEELQYIDALFSASYKWLLGPYGHAFGYFSEELLGKLPRFNASWISSTNSANAGDLLKYTTASLPGAVKFDRGQAPNMLTLSCLQGSLDFLNHIGAQYIDQHNQNLAKSFIELIRSNKKFQIVTDHQNLMSSMVCLRALESNSDSIVQALKLQNIDVSLREGNIRISFHIFNNLQQVQELFDALSKAV